MYKVIEYRLTREYGTYITKRLRKAFKYANKKAQKNKNSYIILKDENDIICEFLTHNKYPITQNEHPGKLLKKMLRSRKIKQNVLAEKTGFSQRHISEVINGKTSIRTNFACELEKVLLDTKAEFWLNLQNSHDVFVYKQE